MSNVNGDNGRRGPDAFGILLFGVIALAAIAGAVFLVEQREFTATGLLLVLVVGGAFLFAQGASHKAALPKNPHVHGEARPATEKEVQRAARGDANPARLDEREF